MPKAKIGLEVHVQLKTKSKMFCSCPLRYGDPPNSLVCPVCLGLPGALPVLNKRAVDFSIQVALALHCKIQPFCQFHRKNYFYPDLPKGYQISQYDLPLARNGYLTIGDEKGSRKIGIQRVHMEEDTAKMIHGESISRAARYSLIDFNRSGIPLLEIVSAPDIQTPDEASAYLMELRTILRTLDVSTANMEEGALRCDVNISYGGGARCEIKNLNSFHSVRKALEYEIDRQKKVLESGGEVVQETRHYDERAGITLTMRRKEEAEDYRYFPEPDLVPLFVSEEWVTELGQKMPELPESKRLRYVELGLTPEQARTISDSIELASFLESTLNYYPKARQVANWLLSEVLKYLNAHNLSLPHLPLTPQAMGEFLKLLEEGTISSKIGKEILEEMMTSGNSPQQIIAKKGLSQIADPEEIRSLVAKTISSFPKEVEEYKKGKKQLFGFLVGQVMKSSSGRANPELVHSILRELLGS